MSTTASAAVSTSSQEFHEKAPRKGIPFGPHLFYDLSMNVKCHDTFDTLSNFLLPAIEGIRTPAFARDKESWGPSLIWANNYWKQRKAYYIDLLMVPGRDSVPENYLDQVVLASIDDDRAMCFDCCDCDYDVITKPITIPYEHIGTRLVRFKDFFSQIPQWVLDDPRNRGFQLWPAGGEAAAHNPDGSITLGHRVLAEDATAEAVSDELQFVFEQPGLRLPHTGSREARQQDVYFPPDDVPAGGEDDPLAEEEEYQAGYDPFPADPEQWALEEARAHYIDPMVPQIPPGGDPEGFFPPAEFRDPSWGPGPSHGPPWGPGYDYYGGGAPPGSGSGFGGGFGGGSGGGGFFGKRSAQSRDDNIDNVDRAMPLPAGEQREVPA
ncbi:hypothetical protein TWF481_001769 [Arthrobotrys musiformis]|uniref:Uncharacterized protein n=1 Tax=Arthrobotrys musiformis TaxID=47236 RepID=A0AAV9VW20_9PEZI